MIGPKPELDNIHVSWLETNDRMGWLFEVIEPIGDVYDGFDLAFLLNGHDCDECNYYHDRIATLFPNHRKKYSFIDGGLFVSIEKPIFRNIKIVKTIRKFANTSIAISRKKLAEFLNL
ncbi:hypothetical protein GEMRC1_000563 [Eukaryota sp. GEM-RC1]